MFNSEKLEGWQKAIDFADLVYPDTRACPSDERFGLTTQCGGPPFLFHPISRWAHPVTLKPILPGLLKPLPARSLRVSSKHLSPNAKDFLNDEQSQKLLRAAEEQSRMHAVYERRYCLRNVE